MRQALEYFGDEDLTLLYIAKKLKEALALEKLLADAGLDYVVEPEKYRGGVLFVSERVGAFFYVGPKDTETATQLLISAGYTPYREGA
jgi:hypothetical protein